jgi:hypothetical protein
VTGDTTIHGSDDVFRWLYRKLTRHLKFQNTFTNWLQSVVGHQGNQDAAHLMSHVFAFEHQWDAEDMIYRVETFRDHFGRWPTFRVTSGSSATSATNATEGSNCLELYDTDEDPSMVDYLDLKVEEEDPSSHVNP